MKSGAKSRFKDRMHKNRLLNILRKKYGKDANLEDKKEHLEEKILYKNKSVDIKYFKPVNRIKKVGIEEVKIISKRSLKLNINNKKIINSYEEIKGSNSKNYVALPENKKGFNYEVNDNTKKDIKVDYQTRLNDKQAVIIKKIKDNFIKKLNELDVIESDLYLINVDNPPYMSKEEIELQRKKIEGILIKINKLIEDYNLFKDNIYLNDNLIWLEDKNLLDNIIEYKEMIRQRKDNEPLEESLRLLEEYKNLYDKLNKVKEENKKLDERNEKKKAELREKDNKYNEFENKTKDIEKTKLIINKFLVKQNKAMSNLENRIGNISAKEITEYRYNGLSKLMYFNAKYIGGLLLLPFRGAFPAIAMNTIAMSYMIRNMKNIFTLEEKKYMYYSAIDYDKELNYGLYSIRDIEVSLTNNIENLRDIEVRIKNELYHYDPEKTKKLLKKINVMKEILNDNIYKVDKIKSRVNTNIKENKKVLTRVKRLNEQEKKAL